jgi:uncharacterized paraquat-inducible protein A
MQIKTPETLDRGLDVVWGYDNIAIVVLMITVLMEALYIGALTWLLFRIKDSLYALTHAFHTLNTALPLLLELKKKEEKND